MTHYWLMVMAATRETATAKPVSILLPLVACLPPLAARPLAPIADGPHHGNGNVHPHASEAQGDAQSQRRQRR
jgi:hypothetical protein